MSEMNNNLEFSSCYVIFSQAEWFSLHSFSLGSSWDSAAWYSWHVRRSSQTEKTIGGLILKTIEDKILFYAGLLTCSEQRLQSLQQIFIKNGHALNSKSLFRKCRAVHSQVYRHLSSLQLSHPKLEEFLSLLKSFKTYCEGVTQFNLEEVERISQRLENDLGKSVMLLKGAAVSRYYRHDTQRNIFDVDVLLPDLETSLYFLQLLKEEGYTLDKVRLTYLGGFQETVSNQYPGQIVGIIITNRKGTDVYADRSASFDICIGAFPGYNNWVLDCSIWDRASVDSQFPGFLLPSPEDNLLVLLIHALRHGRLSLRDINDLYAIISNDRSFDWEYFLIHIEKNNLIPIASLLLQMMAELYSWNLPASVQSALKLTKIQRFSTFLLKRFNRPRNENFNWGGLVLQYLYNFFHYRKQRGGTLFSHVSALKSVLEMFKKERPYRTWSSRDLQNFPSESMRIVFVPVTPRNDKRKWQVEQLDLAQVSKVATRHGIPIHQVDKSLLLWNWKKDDELILTFEGMYTQSSYDGNLSPEEIEKLSLAAASTLELLQKEGAARASSQALLR